MNASRFSDEYLVSMGVGRPLTAGDALDRIRDVSARWDKSVRVRLLEIVELAQAALDLPQEE